MSEMPLAIDSACKAVAVHRRRPILVMFYPPGAQITEYDINDTYQEMRRGGFSKEKPLAELDLLIHTTGGDPVAAYRIAQLIRSMSETLTVLVPQYSYSAGTLLSFAGNSIRLGDYAGLSPIDITIFENRSRSSEGVQLAAVDSFMDFARGARTKMEQTLEEMGRINSTSSVDSDLLVQMVKEVGALRIGKYYRERNLTGHYAEILLDAYMFADVPDGRDRRAGVIRHFLFGAPAHEFHLDFHLCRSWHLNVQRMPTKESDITMKVVDALDEMTDAGVICQRLNRAIRMPFIHFYPGPDPNPEPSPELKPTSNPTGGSHAGRKSNRKKS